MNGALECHEDAPFDKRTGLGSEHLDITGIPTDELASEAIVIEIEW